MLVVVQCIIYMYFVAFKGIHVSIYDLSILVLCVQGDLVLNVSELVIEFVLKLAMAAQKLDQVEIDSSPTLVLYHFLHPTMHRLYIELFVL